jgi:uracil-DNA glycosylase
VTLTPKESDVTLSRLVEEIKACRICEGSLPLGPRPVVQVDEGARLLIVGQAPGRRVHESGVPFSDASGDRLRSWLGVSPEVFYDPRLVAIVPMGFCFPGTGPSGDLPPRPECAPQWRTTLLSGLVSVRLTLVIGQYALRWHLPDAGSSVTEAVRDWRAHWPDLLPLPHPSPRNNRWLTANPWFAQELLPELKTRVSDLLADQA